MDAGPLPKAVFDGFTFDPRRGALFGVDGVEIPLRPKTFAMLRHLLANPNRLIGREELLDAVWPGVFVSDDSITQCVGEIRRALGSDGARLLRTVPRRGYLFETAVESWPPERDAAPVHPPLSIGEPVRAAAAVPAPRPALPVRWLYFGLPPVALLLCGLIIVAQTTGRSTSPAVTQAPRALDPGRTPAQDEGRRLYAEARNAFEGRVSPENWLTARALYERAMAADPTYAPAYAEDAFTYTNMVASSLSIDRAGDLARGEALARRAVALAPDMGLAHSALGAVLRNQRRPAEALASYRMAVALDPVQVPAQANTSLMLTLIGRPEEAVAPIQAAIAARPESVEQAQWHFYLGLAQFQAGLGDHGAAALRRSLDPPVQAVIPADARRLYVAAALALGGEVEEARRVAAAERTSTPTYTQGWFRAHPLSDDPHYLAQAEALFRGLALAGVPE